MKEVADYLAGLSAFGLLAVIVWVIKWFLTLKETLLKEVVKPALSPMKADIEQLQKDVASLKASDKDMAEKMEKQYNAIKDAQAITNQSLAKLQGSVDTLLSRLDK